jgi:hypothetical protein
MTSLLGVGALVGGGAAGVKGVVAGGVAAFLRNGKLGKAIIKISIA